MALKRSEPVVRFGYIRGFERKYPRIQKGIYIYVIYIYILKYLKISILKK